MLLGVPDHEGPRLLFARGWGLGSWRSGFKTMKVLWLFILSLLWMSHSGTKGRDTSSHSRALSWFLSPSLDAQHNMPMDRHAGVHAQLQGKTYVSWLLYIPLSLFLGRTHARTHTNTHLTFSTPLSLVLRNGPLWIAVSEHLLAAWTLLSSLSLKRLRISQILECVSMTIT